MIEFLQTFLFAIVHLIGILVGAFLIFLILGFTLLAIKNLIKELRK